MGSFGRYARGCKKRNIWNLEERTKGSLFYASPSFRCVPKLGVHETRSFGIVLTVWIPDGARGRHCELRNVGFTRPLFSGRLKEQIWLKKTFKAKEEKRPRWP
jgi:hypothetical protein